MGRFDQLAGLEESTLSVHEQNLRSLNSAWSKRIKAARKSVQSGKFKHAADTLETHARHVTQVVRILKKDKAIKVFKEASFDELAGLDESWGEEFHTLRPPKGHKPSSGSRRDSDDMWNRCRKFTDKLRKEKDAVSEHYYSALGALQQVVKTLKKKKGADKILIASLERTLAQFEKTNAAKKKLSRTLIHGA